MTNKSTVALAIKSKQFLNLSHWRFLAIMISKTKIVSFVLQIKSTKQFEKNEKGLLDLLHDLPILNYIYILLKVLSTR